jgi:hypothetical protein
MRHLANKDLAYLQALLDQGPGSCRCGFKALLKSSQNDNRARPGFHPEENFLLHASYANQITPPTVPSGCAEMRRVAEAVPANMTGSGCLQHCESDGANIRKCSLSLWPLEGRILCEEAWLQIASLAGVIPFWRKARSKAFTRGLCIRHRRLRSPNATNHSADYKGFYKPSTNRYPEKTT